MTDSNDWMLRFCFVLLAAFALSPTSAFAVVPAITAIGQQDRHPTLSFTAPRAESVSVYIASKPDQATDGAFLDENMVEFGSLTASEIAQGLWLDASQIKPGFYYATIRASDASSCTGYDLTSDTITHDPSCARGYSPIVTFSVPVPPSTFTAKATVLSAIRLVYLGFVGSPLGDDLPYQVCWKRRNGKQKPFSKACANGTLHGYSWNDDGSDSLTVHTTGMERRTTFTWSTRGWRPKVLLRKTFRIA